MKVDAVGGTSSALDEDGTCSELDEDELLLEEDELLLELELDEDEGSVITPLPSFLFNLRSDGTAKYAITANSTMITTRRIIR